MKTRSICALLGLCAALQLSPAVAAEPAPQQVLDRVFAYNGSAVLNMAFGNAARPPDFTNLLLSANDIRACTLTTVDGLWCLDGRILRKWANPLDPTVRVDVLNCTDPALGLDTLVPDTCTGMTVDKTGVIWLAGKKKLPNNWPNRPWWISEQTWMALQTWFNPYSLVKVTKKVGACPVGTQMLIGGAYCAKEAYSGKYIVTRLSPVDGDAANTFRPCPSCDPQAGVLGIEDLRNVVFFPSIQAPQPIPIPGSSSGLKFGEVLNDVSFLVFEGQGYVLATTNSGHVLSKNPATGGTAAKVFHIPQERKPGSPKCSVAPSHYGIRSAASSAIVFVSDRQYCQVSALVPNASFTALVNLPKSDGSDLTLITKDSSGTFPIFGLTVAPGIGVDFRACTLNCAIVNSVSGAPAAELQEVKLVAGSSFAATVFQMKNLPDCRYAADPLFPAAKRTLCASLSPGVVVNPDGTLPTIDPYSGVSTPSFPPAAQLLNATPLLPGDVTSAFDTSGAPPTGLPRLLISRQYRGQKINNFQFGALFVIPGPGVKYKGVFGGEYDVPALEGKVPNGSLGCLATSNQLADLLKWDVTTAVSESFVGTGSIGGKHIDSLANVGCDSIRGSYSRLSLLPYDLEISPDTYAPTVKWPHGPKLTTGNDAVFARLVDSLIDDLGYAFKELACKAVDPAPNNGPAPLSWNVCNPYSPASEQLYWVRWKFNRCLIGVFESKHYDAYQPPHLRDRQYCQFALDRLALFQQALPHRDSTAPHDVANRLGELHSRVDILRHVYTTRFLPSVPDAGFCRERHACSYGPGTE